MVEDLHPGEWLMRVASLRGGWPAPRRVAPTSRSVEITRAADLETPCRFCDLLAVRGLGGVSGRRPRCLVEQRAGSAAFLVRQPLPRGHKVRGFVLHWLGTYQHTP
jgi:hypothetical protein